MASGRKNWNQMPEAMGSRQQGDRKSHPKMEQVTSNVQAQAAPALQFQGLVEKTSPWRKRHHDLYVAHTGASTEPFS